MLIEELLKEENKDKVFFGKINELTHRLNEYNLGGIPLPLIILCQNLTTTNCYTISKIILDACPDFTFVQGEVESMKKANDCNGIIKNEYDGFHVWLEKDDMVYDPVLALFIDKKFYYLQEKVVVHSKHSLEQIQNESQHNKAFTASKNEPTSIYSKYRMLIILEAMKPFIEQDSWIYSKPLKNAFFSFYDSFDKETIKQEIKSVFPEINKDNFTGFINQLTKNNKYNEDGFQENSICVYCAAWKTNERTYHNKKIKNRQTRTK